ncbi:MAG: winged helix DNA-binding protein [Nitrososphaerota archaeon]|jgi:predicted transcriptional regulator|nr:winged helix DNA-binding protein [Nitrososphaerota archaeon]
MMIVSDILKVVKEEGSKGEGARISSLLRKANLPYNRLTEITDRMVSNGLLEVTPQERGSIYRITPKGEEVLDSLIKFEEFAKAFGLRL